MPERDDFTDLPGLALFGEQLTAATRRAEAPARVARRPVWRTVALTLLVLLGVAATAAASFSVLRGTIIPIPDPRILPAEQTPAGSSVVLTPRSPDPSNGPPWALRLTRSQTGLTCTTVGQIRDDVFGIVGQDSVFRQIPDAVNDACGRGLLLGSRIVSSPVATHVRSIVYGVAGAGVKEVTLVTASERRVLRLGARGGFVAALRGYPEDTAARVELTATDGTVSVHSLGSRPGLVPDLAGAPGWRLTRYVLGTRLFCAHLGDARRPQAPTSGQPDGGRASLPTTCIDRRTGFAWAASALRVHPGQKGRAGFDRWDYKQRPPRTVLLGVARSPTSVVRVTVGGLPEPRTITPAPNGTFALVLPAGVDPDQLRLTVRLGDGRIQHGRPGHGVVPDLVPSRRIR